MKTHIFSRRYCTYRSWEDAEALWLCTVDTLPCGETRPKRRPAEHCPLFLPSPYPCPDCLDCSPTRPYQRMRLRPGLPAWADALVCRACGRRASRMEHAADMGNALEGIPLPSIIYGTFTLQSASRSAPSQYTH
ncbi:hypothetical protein [Desulfobaculum sp.]